MTHRFWLGGVCFATLCVVASVLVFKLMTYTPADKITEERYFRAVYVLQKINKSAAEEKVDIPHKITYMDATESLLHHPDKIFVLQRVADELEASRDSSPQAILFEAYARLALGENDEAAKLLLRYVVDSPYSVRHYTMLSESLHETEDYMSLLVICKEWEGRDVTCSSDRLRYQWAALYNVGRFAEAKELMLSNAPCIGWAGQVYAAKSVQALGDGEKAEKVIFEAMKNYDTDSLLIERLWNKVKEKSIM